MNKNLFQRRQLLMYGGLGLVGAGAAVVFQRTSKSRLSESTPAPSSPVPSGAAVPNPVASSDTNTVSLPELMPLPEFQGISQWLNSAPLTIEQLKGSVVLIQFWTFACINCQRTLPHVTRWHQQYAEQGLNIIGVHTPEFAFERDVSNVQDALKQHQITYPVPIDNDFQTWRAYSNRFWPHLFLADRNGVVRYDHIGEGAYNETEQTIRQLLG